MKIAVAGTGYVGISNAVLLAQNHSVWAVDIIPEKVETLNNKKSPIVDKEIEEYLKTKELDLVATIDYEIAYKDAEFIIVATPTNYDPSKNFFDTSSVENVIEKVLQVNKKAVIGQKCNLCRKALFYKAFLVFMGGFFDLLFFATFSEPTGIEPATFSHN